MQNSKKRKLKPQNLLIVLACICLIIGTFVVLLSNHSASNSDSKAKTVNKHYETIATVMIDAGHGGYDGGTVAEDGTTEKNLTLALALETGKQLKKLNPEIKVVYTRTSDKVTWSEDETEDLKARVKMAKKEKADYLKLVLVRIPRKYKSLKIQQIKRRLPRLLRRLSTNILLKTNKGCLLRTCS